MNGSHEEWTEDLLSAYVDGEVTDQERELIEAQLAESAELRAVLSDVEAARTAVRALPTRDATPEFWARIFDGTAFEGTELDGTELEGAELEPGAPELTSTVIPLESKRSQRRTPRWMVAAGGIAAVAVLGVVAFLPRPQSVTPPVAAFTDAHAVRSSLDADAVSSLAPVAVQAGFRR